MQVVDTVDLGEGHSIEFGTGSWPGAESLAVRNRYSSRTGGFIRASGEIPLGDLVEMVVETARRGYFSVEDAGRIVTALTDGVIRGATPRVVVGPGDEAS